MVVRYVVQILAQRLLWAMRHIVVTLTPYLRAIPCWLSVPCSHNRRMVSMSSRDSLAKRRWRVWSWPKPCSVACSPKDMTIRLSSRLSVLQPLIWCTTSSGDNWRPNAASIIRRCSFLPLRAMLTRLYPYTSRWVLLRRSDMACRCSGWSRQYARRAAAYFARTSGESVLPIRCSQGLRLGMSNAIRRFSTVFRHTPNSLAISSAERVRYCSVSHLGSFSLLSITALYHGGNG